MDIYRQDPYLHHNWAATPPELRPARVDYKNEDDLPQPDPRGLGAYEVVEVRRDGAAPAPFAVDFLAADRETRKAAVAAARATPGLDRGERARLALRLIGERQAGRQPAPPPPPPAPPGHPHGFAPPPDPRPARPDMGFAQASVPASVVAAAQPPLRGGDPYAAGGYHPPAPPAVDPPRVRVDIWLAGSAHPLRYYYHRAYREGAWLRLVVDDRYPGVARFPVDYQDQPFTVAVEGEPTAYIVHSAGDAMSFAPFSISSLLIEGDVPLEA